MLNATQLVLDGFDAPMAPTDGLFFAIFPDVEASARAARLGLQLTRAHELRATPHGQGRLHITLAHLGNFAGMPIGLVRQACEVAASLRCSRFDVVLDHVFCFSGRAGQRPLVLQGREGVRELTAFQHGLDMALKRAGVVRKATQAYNPHLTLLYGGKDEAVAEIVPISWTAREFALVHSFLGQGRYEVLGRWPLG